MESSKRTLFFCPFGYAIPQKTRNFLRVKRLYRRIRGTHNTIRTLAAGMLISGVVFGGFITDTLSPDTSSALSTAKELAVLQGNTLLPITNPATPLKTIKKINMIITAYSSTVWQTDDDPFITASGDKVRDGIVANNLLSFGTKVRMPELYGDKVFTVQDRMHRRKGYYHLDIWFSSYTEATNFGAKETYVEVLEG